ncbi:MAG TPA: hypothetical protein VJR89_08730, partial [Polyangiales bacterium]|nr:hypothetical protein [Polyangiales bacterium]
AALGASASVGIGIPGSISPTTALVRNANSTWLNGRPLKRDLEARLARESKEVRARVQAHHGDMRRVRLGRRFPLVIAPFNLFMHLYTLRDLERGLATVRAHLAPRGRFVMDVQVPDLGALRRDPAKVYSCRPVYDPTDQARYAYGEAYAYDPIRQVQTVRMLFQRVDKPDVERETPLTLRCYFPEELRALLHYNGFSVVARYGDFAGGPLGSHSDQQIIVARARGGFEK